jgi:hypothetical protein
MQCLQTAKLRAHLSALDALAEMRLKERTKDNVECKPIIEYRSHHNAGSHFTRGADDSPKHI